MEPIEVLRYMQKNCYGYKNIKSKEEISSALGLSYQGGCRQLRSILQDLRTNDSEGRFILSVDRPVCGKMGYYYVPPVDRTGEETKVAIEILRKSANEVWTQKMRIDGQIRAFERRFEKKVMDNEPPEQRRFGW